MARIIELLVTQAVLMHCTLLSFGILLKCLHIYDETRNKLKGYYASRGWLVKFIKRHAVRSVSLHGKGDSVSVPAVAAGMVEIQKSLQDLDAECIFNVDETGLFFKHLPKRTYVTEQDTMKTVRETKEIKSEDPIIPYVCTNAVGDKVPMVVNGKAKNLKCFQIEKLSVPYFSE